MVSESRTLDLVNPEATERLGIRLGGSFSRVA